MSGCNIIAFFFSFSFFMNSDIAKKYHFEGVIF